jgi:hypothetical protein
MTKPIRHITAKYPRTQREVMVAFYPLTQDPITQLAQKACKGINSVLMRDKNINVLPFLYGASLGMGI